MDPWLKPMSSDQNVLEVGTSNRKHKSLEFTSSASSHMAGERSSQNLLQDRKLAEIKRLERRLRALEEEGELLRETFLESVEERTKLMTEIYDEFETIQHCLLLRGRRTDGDQTVSQFKDRKPGLLQVLRQESSPSLVNRDLRAKAIR